MAPKTLPGSSPHVGFTVREREILEAIIEASNRGDTKPLRWAADKLAIEYTTVRNTLQRIRNRYWKAKQFIQDYRDYQKKMRGRRYL
jgi:DNA-binding CsgD family transcriptional regulator